MARGGKREGSGPKTKADSVRREYRIPKRYLVEATSEIKVILRKYRDLCKTNR